MMNEIIMFETDYLLVIGGYLLLAILTIALIIYQNCMLRNRLISPASTAKAIMKEFQREYKVNDSPPIMWSVIDEMMREKLDTYLNELETEIGYYLDSNGQEEDGNE